MPGKFIRFVEDRGLTRYPCKVAAGTIQDARQWQRDVQPHIRKLPKQVGQDWKWPNLVTATQSFERLMGRRATYVQLVMERGLAAVPIAQMILSVGYPFLAAREKSSVYLWYLARAPETYLNQFGIPKIRVMPYLVDTAIQISFQAGFQGRVCLHAASSGNRFYDDQLFDAYQVAGMVQLPPHKSVGLSKSNDGRYFTCDESKALALSATLDYLR